MPELKHPDETLVCTIRSPALIPSVDLGFLPVAGGLAIADKSEVAILDLHRGNPAFGRDQTESPLDRYDRIIMEAGRAA